MSVAKAWLGLLQEVGDRFTAFADPHITLQLIITPDLKGFPGKEWPPQVAKEMRKQVLAFGGMPPGSVFGSNGWFHLFAQPVAPDLGYWQIQAKYAEKFKILAEEAWRYLPDDIRI